MQTRMLALLASAALLYAAHAQAVVSNLITSPAASDAPGLVVPLYMQTECTWRGDLVRSVVNNASGMVSVSPEAAKHGAGRVLDLQISTLTAPPKGDTSKRRLGVQAKLFFDGKWVAVKNFEDRSVAVSTYTPCESIGKLANNLGSDVADWLRDMDPPVCDSACTGLHPNDPIAIGKEILLASPGAIDEQILSCNWPSQMVKDFVEDANDTDTPPSRKLFVTNEDILTYPGRKLVLKAIEVRVAGGASGDKRMEMSGELIDGGVLVASFHGYQKVRFGSSNPCKTLHSLSENMYGEIENWLVEPTMKAELR